MKLTIFYITATLIYLAGAGFLIREFRRTTPQERHELQTIPLFLAATSFYLTIILKTHQLAVLFADYL